MFGALDPPVVTTYQFEIDDEKWNDWKNTVPRTKSLETRIIELIEADTDGRVQPPDESEDGPRGVDIAESGLDADASQSADAEPAPVSEVEEERLDAVSFPSGVDRDDGLAAIYAARDHLREHGGASMREIVLSVMPDHPLKYDPPETLETGDRYRGAWWRRVVKPGLEALPDVEKPGSGESNWQYVGES